jgi:hypothetical protein
MTTIQDIFTTCAPEYLARSPHLPLAHQKAITTIRHCQSGQYGHRLSRCHSCGKPHRVNHAFGNRHCPPCQHHKTQQWFYHHLDTQLPGPHFLVTCTVPETLRPFLRSHQRAAYQALVTASSTALKRLTTDQRFIGTDLPGLIGILHTWGRQLQYHPYIHSIVPGGGLSKDRSQWLPSRDHCFGPVKALSPISRALFTPQMDKAGLLECLDTKVWNIPWNVHRQANPDGATSFQYLAPSGCRVAISNRIR